MLTVSDLMSHLAIQIDTVLAGSLEAKVRNAVLNAWGRLMGMHAWAYFHRMGTLLTYAGQSDGTVSFDVATRTLTLTDATWPSNAVARHVRLGGKWYPIWRRTSSTVLTLFEGQHPIADLTDEAYLLQQVMYPLPYEVSDVVQLLDGSQSFPTMRLNLLDTFQILGNDAWSASIPHRYSLVADSANPQRWNLWIPVEQTTDIVLQYMYVVRKPPNAIARVRRGTVSVASGVATFSDPVITTDWTGVLLRVAKNDSGHPTGEFGDMPGNAVELNQDCYELRVQSVTSTTICTVHDITASATDANYNASTMIDVGDGPMHVLLQRLCESEYGVRTVGGHTEAMVSASRLGVAFNEARNSDGRLVRQRTISGAWYNVLGVVR